MMKVKSTTPTQSPWIKHVKDYQKSHNCSYSEALKGAAKTYIRTVHKTRK
jgi:hypothetical protein